MASTGKTAAYDHGMSPTHTFGHVQHTKQAQLSETIMAVETTLGTQHHMGGLAPPTLNSAVPVTGKTSHTFRVENKRQQKAKQQW
jgi:hypothetical protein